MRAVTFAIGCSLFCSAALAQFEFTAHTISRGLEQFEFQPGMAHGVSVADFDNDGDVDILVPTAQGEPPRLFRNDGSGNFEDIAKGVGLDSLSNDRCALFVDYDGDADLDVLLINDEFLATEAGERSSQDTIRLFQLQPDGWYIEVTAEAGLSGSFYEGPLFAVARQHLGGANLGDFDGDGDLDLALGIWRGRRGIYMNNGDGTFEDASPPPATGFTGDDWQPHVQDFNGDGLADIYWAIDFSANELLLSNGDMTFTNNAVQWGLANDFNDMGIACGDFNNDGRFDYYIANIHDDRPAGSQWTSTHNVLLQDMGPDAFPRFRDIATSAGAAYASWAWGCDFADFDNDLDEDLIVSNGFNNEWSAQDRSRLYENHGNGPLWFTEVGQSAGVDDTDYTSGLVTADIDRDGDLDAIQIVHGGQVRIYENTTTKKGNWIVVKPRRHDNANHFSVSAVVTLEIGGVKMQRLITNSTSILSQKPFEAHFGLSGAEVIDRIEVRWLDGATSVIENDPRINEVITITPGVYLDAERDDVPFGGYRDRRLIDQDTREGYPDG